MKNTRWEWVLSHKNNNIFKYYKVQNKVKTDYNWFGSILFKKLWLLNSSFPNIIKFLEIITNGNSRNILVKFLTTHFFERRWTREEEKLQERKSAHRVSCQENMALGELSLKRVSLYCSNHLLRCFPSVNFSLLLAAKMEGNSDNFKRQNILKIAEINIPFKYYIQIKIDWQEINVSELCCYISCAYNKNPLSPD